jgi:hypothetical protein
VAVAPKKLDSRCLGLAHAICCVVSFLYCLICALSRFGRDTGKIVSYALQVLTRLLAANKGPGLLFLQCTIMQHVEAIHD